MPKGKHLTLDDRRSIQIGLGEGRSFKDIADEIADNLKNRLYNRLEANNQEVKS